MKTIDIANATESLGRYARELNQETLVLTQQGQPIAALLPIDETDIEGIKLGTNARFLAIIKEARAQVQAGAGLSTDEVRRQLGLPATH
jgi:antitoxin (DNA-binding transcriptional repressor) of toxin-antitoxin stability system